MKADALAALVLLPACTTAQAGDPFDDVAAGKNYATVAIQHAVHDDASVFGDQVLAELTVGAEYNEWLAVEMRLQTDARDAANVLFGVNDQSGGGAGIKAGDGLQVGVPLTVSSGLSVDAGLYVRASAPLADDFGLYAVAGAGYAVFRVRQCVASAANTLCNDVYRDEILPGFGAGAHVQLGETLWLGAEVRRLQGEDIRMTVYGLNVGYGF